MNDMDIGAWASGNPNYDFERNGDQMNGRDN